MKNLLKIFTQPRFRLLFTYAVFYLAISDLIRCIFYFWSLDAIDFSIINFLRVLLTGTFFDLGTISFFVLPYTLYLLLFPNKWIGGKLDKWLTYIGYSIGLIIFSFSFMAEFTFWDEFKNRFNFIAVDYLIYTYEVVQNINESYPMPLIILAILSVVTGTFYLTSKKDIFHQAFNATIELKQKISLTVIVAILASIYGFTIDNKHAEWSENRYENELSKSGIYSFFAAFRNNELSYSDFYLSDDIEKSVKRLKKLTLAKNEQYIPSSNYSLKRTVNNEGSELKPNVIFICIESFDAKFMDTFGNGGSITPFLDSIASQSILFTNLFATGTRTVRGMEAITLSVPPSPGRSIVKRKKNTGFFNIGTVFKSKGYKNVFFYGGDGYFDNMNQFFGGNGFEIVDRGRGYLMGDDFISKRTNIEDNEVTFENAWGVCDEDIYRKVLKEADENYKSNQPFFNFIMTTSNHRPFTYPEGKIDIPSKSGRHGAIKYTDFAIREFIKSAKQKPWFENTVFVIMSDHCASSAGRQELNVADYHIPAIIYNSKDSLAVIDKNCSQIDLFPTLFGYLNWSYTSQLFGRDINQMEPKDERAFVSNYRKMGYLKNNELVVLGDQMKANCYIWKREQNELTLSQENNKLVNKALAYYQSQSYFYENDLLKPAN